MTALTAVGERPLPGAPPGCSHVACEAARSAFVILQNCRDTRQKSQSMPHHRAPPSTARAPRERPRQAPLLPPMQDVHACVVPLFLRHSCARLTRSAPPKPRSASACAASSFCCVQRAPDGTPLVQFAAASVPLIQQQRRRLWPPAPSAPRAAALGRKRNSSLLRPSRSSRPWSWRCLAMKSGRRAAAATTTARRLL